MRGWVWVAVFFAFSAAVCGTHREGLSAADHFNSGCEAYNRGDMVQARLHFERAVRHNSTDREALGNIEFLLRKKLGGDHRAEADALRGPAAWLNSALLLSDWLLLFIATGGIGALVIVLRLLGFRPARGKIGVVLLSLGLSAAVISGIMSGIKTYRERVLRYLLVTAEKTELRAGPDEDNQAVGTFYGGAKVLLKHELKTGKNEVWYRVVGYTGLTGWLPERAVTPIEK